MLLTTRYTFPNKHLTIPLSLNPAILRVNRQINEEATNVLHGDNFWIIVEVNVREWPGANAILPFVSRKDPSYIKYPALHVKLDLPRETTAAESTTLIMGLESLPFLLHKLRMGSAGSWRADDLKAAGLTLRLYSSPFHSQPKLQSKCLEPFTLVRGFGKLSVMGEPDPMGTRYREDMTYRALSPFTDAGVVKGIAMNYLAQGDDAYSLGNCITAYVYYANGMVFLDHAGKSLLAYSLTQAQYPQAQRAREEFEMETARKLLRAHCLRPILAMGQDKNVIGASKSLILGSPFITKVEQVGVMFCRALSSWRLGDYKEWSDLMSGACKLEVAKHDFVQVVLDVCPEPLREHMRFGEGCLDSCFEMKDMWDRTRCAEKGGDEST